MPGEVVTHLGITENQLSDSRGDIRDTGPRELDQRLGNVPSRQKDSHCKGCGVTAWLERLTAAARR